MSLGEAPRQQDLLDGPGALCTERVAADSLFAFLHRERDRLFPDSMFEDLYHHRGRRSVPPSVLACVLVMQRLCELSDRDACEAFTFDARWKWASGVPFEFPSFVHTVLVDFRARLRASDDPKRVFRVTRNVADQAGLIGTKRALDSTPLYDAVATMDTVTLVRSAIRGVLRVLDGDLRERVRAALKRDDDYVRAGKPVCDWDDVDEREELIDALARDGYAALAALEGEALSGVQREAIELLASVLGQDLETGEDDRFKIIRGVAKDRIISTVDPDARHGHKTNHRRYDGYKGHIAIDPESEIITDAEVSAANEGDGKFAESLTEDLRAQPAIPDEPKELYGDSAYASGENLADYQRSGLEAMTRLPEPSNRNGLFSKAAFQIDIDAETVTCPNGVTVPLRPQGDGGGVATFGGNCHTCPLMQQCTKAAAGRTIRTSPHERLLQQQRTRQRDPDWQAAYKGTRPKVERKIAHNTDHGRGRTTRYRGRERVRQHWQLKSATTNLKRLAKLGAACINGNWKTPDPQIA